MIRDLFECIFVVGSSVLSLCFIFANIVAFLIGIDFGVDGGKDICSTGWGRYTAAKVSCFLSEKQGGK